MNFMVVRAVYDACLQIGGSDKIRTRRDQPFNGSLVDGQVGLFEVIWCGFHDVRGPNKHYCGWN